MEISAALIADIDDLCRSVGPDPEQVIDPLAALSRDLRLAVRSYLGLQLVLADHPLHSLTAFTPLMQVKDIATSLYLPLTLLEPEGGLTLYAAQPGAFSELADELTEALTPAEFGPRPG